MQGNGASYVNCLNIWQGKKGLSRCSYWKGIYWRSQGAFTTRIQRALETPVTASDSAPGEWSRTALERQATVGTPRWLAWRGDCGRQTVGVISKRVVHEANPCRYHWLINVAGLLSTKFTPTSNLRAQQHGTKNNCFNELNLSQHMP